MIKVVSLSLYVFDICRSEEKCQELMQQVRNAPREEEVERFHIIVITHNW